MFEQHKNVFFSSFAIPYEKVILNNKRSQSVGVTKQRKSKWIKFWYFSSI